MTHKISTYKTKSVSPFRGLGLFILFLSVSALSIHANTVSAYFDNIRQTGRADFNAGMQIVRGHSTPELLNVLNEFYSDTLVVVRRQAYFLTYRKALEEQENTHLQALVVRLAQGLNDSDGALRGTIIRNLQGFPLSAFNEESKRLIATGINNPHSPHYDELVLLAGFVGVGVNDLLRLSMNMDLPVRTRWNISLALARLGNEDVLETVVERIRRAPVNSGMVLNLLPDLIYTRQKPALDYAVELLFIDEKLCRTANPDLSASILCAYPIIQLIAPVIVGFPIAVDPVIGLETDDYEALLQTVRRWFEENIDFEIRTDTF